VLRNSAFLIIAICIIFCACKGKTVTDSSVKADVQGFANITTNQNVVFLSISAKVAAIPKVTFMKGRDPFFTSLLFVSKTKQASGAVKRIEKGGATQKHEIDKYKLTGVMIAYKIKNATFEDPEGKVWVLKEGNFLGNEGSKVKKITLDGVWIDEPYIDEDNNQKLRERLIPIKKMK